MQMSQAASRPAVLRTSTRPFRCSQSQRPAAARRLSVTSAASAESTAAKVAELKQQLVAIIDKQASTTQYPHEAEPILQELEDAIKGDDVPELSADSIRGRYKQVFSNTNFVAADGTLGLGVLTFNQFKPVDAKLKLLGVELLQGVESEDQYSTEATFEFVEGELAGVRGVQKTLGRFEISQETRGRQDVYFAGVQIFPKRREDVDTWTRVLGQHNEDMDIDGTGTRMFPGQAAHGFRDFRVLDNELHFTTGNRKSFVVVQPIDD